MRISLLRDRKYRKDKKEKREREGERHRKRGKEREESYAKAREVVKLGAPICDSTQQEGRGGLAQGVARSFARHCRAALTHPRHTLLRNPGILLRRWKSNEFSRERERKRASSIYL